MATQPTQQPASLADSNDLAAFMNKEVVIVVGPTDSTGSMPDVCTGTLKNLDGQFNAVVVNACIDGIPTDFALVRGTNIRFIGVPQR